MKVDKLVSVIWPLVEVATENLVVVRVFEMSREVELARKEEISILKVNQSFKKMIGLLVEVVTEVEISTIGVPLKVNILKEVELPIKVKKATLRKVAIVEKLIAVKKVI